jgi:hypothetical protein
VTALTRRQRLLRLRAAIALRTNHRLSGFLSDGTRLPVHDTRGPGGSCGACAVLARLDAALHPGAEVRPSSLNEGPRERPSGQGES